MILLHRKSKSIWPANKSSGRIYPIPPSSKSHAIRPPAKLLCTDGFLHRAWKGQRYLSCFTPLGLGTGSIASGHWQNVLLAALSLLQRGSFLPAMQPVATHSKWWVVLPFGDGPVRTSKDKQSSSFTTSLASVSYFGFTWTFLRDIWNGESKPWLQLGRG